jgi:hypothetical protein
VVEWGEGTCLHQGDFKRECSECWDDLKRLAEAK